MPDLRMTAAIHVMAEPDLAQAVAAAARRNRSTMSDYVRRALRERVEQDGIVLADLTGITVAEGEAASAGP